MDDIIIGIDLGTTNSEVAVLENGRPVILTDAEGRTMLPSVVGVGEDGLILVGETARNQHLLYPEKTVKSIKRRMGQDVKESMAGVDYTPQEISGMILKRLKGIAETRLGKPVSKAVITVPAYFSDAQRLATREAGEIAGLEVVRILNEPTAATLAYNAGHQGGKTLLVYDLGGGTFDVSVVRIEQGVVEVLSSHGNNHLGGDDFDDRIVAWITETLKEEHGLDPMSQPKVRARITRAAETAKKHLSDHPFARIEEEFLAEKDGKPVHLSLELSREAYEAMISPYIDETMEAIHTALNGAGLAASDVEEILLVGGASRTPLVSRRLQEEFRFPPHSEVDPDLCVALGAAIQAAAIAGETVSAILVDVTPYTFGTSALSTRNGTLYPYCFIPVIPKNTPIPVSKSEAFFTVMENQEKVEVRIFQGENPDALRNIELGQFMIEGLRKAPAGDPIIMNFQLDVNGILHISAQEKETGLEKRITIHNALSRLDDEGLSEARGRLSALFGEEEEEGEKDADPEADPHRQDFVKALALKEKAERMLEQAEQDDRDEMTDLIEAILDAVEAKDAAALTEPVEQLADILFYLET